MAVPRAMLLVVAALACATPSVAQHEHGAAMAAAIGHDGPPDGTQFVGNLAHFDVVDVGDDEVPDFHQQNHVRVELDGQVLYETTPDSGHDYDGVQGFDVVFPAPGAYRVVLLGEDGTSELASLAGAVESAPAGLPRHDVAFVEAPTGPVGAGLPVAFAFSSKPGPVAAGTPVDAWFEVFRDGALQFRTATHGADGTARIQYAFQAPGDYEVAVTAYTADPHAVRLLPATASMAVHVLPGVAPPGGRLPSLQRPDPPGTNAVAVDAAEDFTLVGTYDPWTTVGPTTMVRMAALAMDPATRMPLQGTLFGARLTDAASGATLFASEGAQPDGVWDWQGLREAGRYLLDVEAHRGNSSAHVALPFTVLPAADASTVGPVSFRLDTATARPGPLEFVLHATDSHGMPFAHSEADIAIRPAGGAGLASAAPVLVTKLHTHGTGAFPFLASLPPGQYVIEVDGSALEGQPVSFGGPTPGSPATFAVAVPPGHTVDSRPPPPPPGPGPTHESPLPWGIGAAGVVGAACLRRRK